MFVRFILHSDLNNFYASVACLQNPSLKHKPVVVVGDASKRHGIVLSKNGVAKARGVKTGETIYAAREKAGQELVCVQAMFGEYIKISKQVKDIYRRYTSKVESFGIDEAWLDVSMLTKTFAGAEELAHHLRQTVLQEVGITVSVGVSYNKVFAKLGSDYKKPNAVTVITPDNFKQIVWPLPVQELLFVGRQTTKQLNKAGILTIQDLAKSQASYLMQVFGKNGKQLHCHANGLDEAPVKEKTEPQKSISNGTTTEKDLQTLAQVRSVIVALAEQVVKRMAKQGWWCQRVGLSIKDAKLKTITRQKHLDYPICNIKDVVAVCMSLFEDNYNWHTTVRALTVGTSHFCEEPKQLNMFADLQVENKKQTAEQAVNNLRAKYGKQIIERGKVLLDSNLHEIDMDNGLQGIMYKK